MAAFYVLVSKLERGQRRHDGRFNAIDRRFNSIDGRLNELAQGMATVIDLVSRRPAHG